MTDPRDSGIGDPATLRGFLAGVIVIVTALLVAAFLFRDAERSPSLQDPVDSTASSPESDLDGRDESRRTPAADDLRLVELTERVEALEAQLKGIEGDGDADPGERGALADDLDLRSAALDPNTAKRSTVFDDDALLAQGIDAREVARLREFWERFQLDSEELSNRAMREGWFFKQRHRVELAQLEQDLRASLPGEDFDRYLYALGENNRLRASEVLAGSSASEAGLLPGDLILSYEDERVFKPGELVRAAAEGEPGESIAVKILRDGRPQTVYVRRGPLGVIVEHTRGALLPK